MTDYLDHLLDELVPIERDTGNWGDVLERAHRSRRRYVVAFVALAALVLVPAAWAAVNAFEGTPAPAQVIQQRFISTVAMNPATGSILFEHVPDASKAYGVLQLQTSDGPLDLWAAPETNTNGTCWFAGWESDLNAQYGPSGTSSCTENNDAAINPRTYSDASHPSYTVIVGSVTGPETTLDVTLTDGSTTTLPVAEHLFLGALPPGSQLGSITGRDAAGNVVASWTPPS